MKIGKYASFTVVVLLIIATRLIPLLPFDARPGGDASLAVFWGNDVIIHHDLPNVETAWEFNEQPRDYNRPILYVFSALPTLVAHVPIVTVIGWLSVLGALALIALIGAIGFRITGRWQVGLLAALIGSLAGPWFRYLFPVGYHFQNIFGEVLVLLFVFLTTELVRSPRRWSLYVAAAMTLFSTFLFHQLSTFIAGLFLVFLTLWAGWKWRHTFFRQRKTTLIVIGGALAVVILFWIVFGNSVYWEVRSFFTPDLRNREEVRGLLEQFRVSLTGSVLALLGVGLVVRRRLQSVAPMVILFLVIVVAMMGPTYGLNVPPQRVANYLVGPAAVLTALVLEALARKFTSRFAQLSVMAVVAVVVSVQLSLYTVSLTQNRAGGVRSSQMTSAEEKLATWLKAQPAGKAIYDYNTYEQGIWLMPLSGRYVYSAVNGMANVLGPYLADPLIARKVENDQKIGRLLDDATLSNEEFMNIANNYNVRYFIVRGQSVRNVSKRPFLNLVHKVGPVSVYGFSEVAATVR